MTQEAAARHIEVLCKLPLSELALLKALIEALHDVVPSQWNGGGLFTDDGRPGSGYGEHEAFLTIASRWHTECEARFGDNATLTDLNASNRVGNTLDLQKPGYENSPVYRNLFQPVGVKWFIDVPLGDASGAIGGMMLYRGPDGKPFSEDDCKRLEEVRPMIVRALREARQCGKDWNPGSIRLAPSVTASGAVLASPDGQIRGVTRNARRLLEMMATETYSVEDFADVVPATVAKAIETLCAQLDAPEDKGHDPKSTRGCQNGFGGFQLTATKLGGTSLPREFPGEYEVVSSAKPGEPLVAIAVEYREPLVLHLATAMRKAGLTPAQVHVGVLLLTGHSQPGIASLIGIKRSSVDDTVRKIYERLDVHSVVDLAWRFAGPTLPAGGGKHGHK